MKPDLDALERMEREATPLPLTITRYEHGGGRLFQEPPPDGRSCFHLVADFYGDGGDREFFVALRNAAPYLLAAARLAESIMRGGEWANLSEDGDCLTCGEAIADERGHLTLPHRDGCAFEAFREAWKGG